MKMILRALILVLFFLHHAMAGEARFQDCYAAWNDSELTLGNARFERKWKIHQGLLTPVSFLDKPSGREWLRAANRQPAPHPGGQLAEEERVLEVAARSGKLGVVEAGSLVLDLRSTGKAASFDCRLQVFPEASGVGITFHAAAPAATQQALNGNDASDGIEGADRKGRQAKAVAVDAIDDLLLSIQHSRFGQIELADRTDDHNELVQHREWMTLRDTLELQGNVFHVEDPLSGDGLVFLKLAPLPHARPLKTPVDARMLGGNRRVQFLGHGYSSVLLAYSGGRAGRIAALQDYQRCLREFDPARDARFLSNTWGDRSRDARVTEEFLRQEIDAGARLGVDVVQVDDGWQKGVSGNSASGKGAWGNFYAADPDFWSAHPERFPNGLKPLVDAATAKGMKFGLWFGPDSQNDMEHWKRDADLLLGASRKEGVEYVKIDAVKMVSKTAEERLLQFYNHVLDGTDGRLVFDADVTAGLRTGYFGAPHTGPIFVENRYTDWKTYWPHLTLRNLWQLAGCVDPLRLRMEFLNNQRNTESYGDDPLAPARYSPDALFATVMFSNPLGWFEVSQLPDSYFKSIPPLVDQWKAEREAIFSGHIVPIGEAPDGMVWTGLASVSKDRQSARLVIFRELNEQAEWSFGVPLLAAGKRKVSILGGEGEARIEHGRLHVSISEKLGYLFLRID